MTLLRRFSRRRLLPGFGCAPDMAGGQAALAPDQAAPGRAPVAAAGVGGFLP